jgi:hypothetical protein
MATLVFSISSICLLRRTASAILASEFLLAIPSNSMVSSAISGLFDFFLLVLFLSELVAVEEVHDWTTFNGTLSVGSSVGSFRQGLGLEARHSNCPQSWNGQPESLGGYLDATLVDGNRVPRPSNRGKVLSRDIWNRVESMKRKGVKQANSKSSLLSLQSLF